MARRTRAPKLENATSRLKLSVRKKPYGTTIAPSVILLYRRNKGPGTWAVRLTGGKDQVFRLAQADDYADADGREVLDYWQAQDRARAKAREYEGTAEPATVEKALDDYESDLKTRGADIANVKRARAALAADMLKRNVSSITAAEWKRWRDRLAKTVVASTVNRTATCVKAALNLAADHDERIVRRAWETGLATIPGAEESRNVILSAELVQAIVTEAREPNLDGMEKLKGEDREKAERDAEKWAEAFGLFTEVLAVSGARPSQAARLNVHDLPADGDPRLMMPSSKKGKGVKKVLRRPIPISSALALRLRSFAAGKPGTTPLLPKPSGERWAKSDHSRPFARAVARLKAKKDLAKQLTQEIARVEADGESVTIYALRHSNIVRQLKANAPIRIVAANHDTSVAMIERNYSEFITDHTDDISRAVMLEIAAPQRNNVVTIGRTGT
jgi:hypothetical protein